MIAPPLAGNVLGSGDNAFVIAEWRDGGGPPGPEPRLIAPRHVHNSDDEAWYVLEGVLCVEAHLSADPGDPWDEGEDSCRARGGVCEIRFATVLEASMLFFTNGTFAPICTK